MILPSLVLSLHRSFGLRLYLQSSSAIFTWEHTNDMFDHEALAANTMSAGLMLVLHLHHGMDHKVFMFVIMHKRLAMQSHIRRLSTDHDGYSMLCLSFPFSLIKVLANFIFSKLIVPPFWYLQPSAEFPTIVTSK